MGMRVLTVIDQGAWIATRLVGLFQALIGEFISTVYHPNPCRPKEYKNFELIHSMIFSGWMIFNSRKPENLPSMIRERALNIGRLILGVFVICVITNMIESFI